MLLDASKKTENTGVSLLTSVFLNRRSALIFCRSSEEKCAFA